MVIIGTSQVTTSSQSSRVSATINAANVASAVSRHSLGGDVDKCRGGTAVVVPAAQFMRLGQVRVQSQHGTGQTAQRLAAHELGEATPLR